MVGRLVSDLIERIDDLRMVFMAVVAVLLSDKR